VPPEASTKEKYTKYIRRWVWAELGLLVFTVGMFAAAAFMPATKTLAAMYIVPKLTSPEAQQFIEKEYAELKELLHEALNREIIYDWSLGRDRLTVMFWPNQIHWVWDLDGASAIGSIPVSPKAMAEKIAQA